MKDDPRERRSVLVCKQAAMQKMNAARGTADRDPEDGRREKLSSARRLNAGDGDRQARVKRHAVKNLEAARDGGELSGDGFIRLDRAGGQAGEPKAVGGRGRTVVSRRRAQVGAECQAQEGAAE